MSTKEIVGFALLAVGVLIFCVAYLFTGDEWCPKGQTYQVTKYEPQFNGAKMPTYKPVYGCK